MSPIWREIVNEVARSKVFDGIADSTAVSAAVLRYLCSKERRMEFTTTSFDSMHAEGAIIDYLHSPEGERLLRDNIRQWLSLLDCGLDLLSNMVTEADPNLLAPAIGDTI